MFLLNNFLSVKRHEFINSRLWELCASMVLISPYGIILPLSYALSHFYNICKHLQCQPRKILFSSLVAVQSSYEIRFNQTINRVLGNDSLIVVWLVASYLCGKLRCVVTLAFLCLCTSVWLRTNTDSFFYQIFDQVGWVGKFSHCACIISQALGNTAKRFWFYCRLC